MLREKEVLCSALLCSAPSDAKSLGHISINPTGHKTCGDFLFFDTNRSPPLIRKDDVHNSFQPFKEGGEKMTWNKLFQRGLLGVAIFFMAAFQGSEIEGSICGGCLAPGISGTVTLWDGNPPSANTTTVHFVCLLGDCTDRDNINCEIGNADGEYYVFLGECPTPAPGQWEIWATYIMNNCKYSSDHETVDWDGTSWLQVDLVINENPIACW